jgi:DNA polymerase (family 10)
VSQGRRFSRSEAQVAVEALVCHEPAIIVCGSWRRGCPTVGDLDCVVVGWGERRHFFIGDIPVEMTPCAPSEIGAMMLHATGSRDFNIECRCRAKAHGMKLNQHGLWRDTGELVASDTEEHILRSLGLDWIEPERR